MHLQKILRLGLILTLSTVFINCASKTKDESLDKDSKVAAETPVSEVTHSDQAVAEMRPPTDTSVASNSHEPPADGFKVELKKIKDLAQSHQEKHDSHAATSAHESPKGIAPEKALGWLKNGNIRFRNGSLRKDGQSRKDVARLSSGQSPHTIVVSCSDSRTSPEILFDQKLGEIFVIRTAGQGLDPNAIASVEYAVEHLGTRNIVVMGHTNCGAVKAAWSTMDGKSAGSENLDHLMADLRPHIAPLASKGVPSKDYENEGWANADGVAQDLVSRSKILTGLTGEGKVKVSSALYHLDSGSVDFKP